MKKRLSLLSLLLLNLSVFAQNPAPAAAQSKPIALVGGTIHVGDGKIIQNGTIIFDKGIITAIGDASTTVDKNSTEVINVQGKSVYPGIIAPAALIGLVEIGSVRSTFDQAENGQFNPNIRSLIAHNTDSEIIPTVRGNGVLIGQTTPEGSIISGTSSIMEYDGWNWEDAVLKKDDGIWLNYPTLIARQFSPEESRFVVKKNDKYIEQKNALQNFLADALAYAEITNPNPKNAKLEAMKGLFDGSKKLFIRTNYGKEIIEASKLAQQYKVKSIVIVGGEEADLALDFLKTNNIPVIVSPTHRLPNTPDEDVWNPYKLPARLMKAGVLTGMFYTEEFYKTRNLPFVAGTSAAFGMEKEDALKMITLNNAKILGIDNLVGTLEVGKQATIAVSEGDILDMRTNKVEYAFIRGKKINLDDKQKRLYKKYVDKYGISGK
ncbi:Imidazolonepropionase [Emticicia aquatica]|uniref:Imidazolonepropionase n=1 Tax=Emticicia aquatica TaxID=1681835 RepID=A0ABM9ANV6_9BACT|nr:amidohydrolase family protein [Emticicia aquatica]CAH0995299.1 Imidazolonepropionase [Emticicia aquatica]